MKWIAAVLVLAVSASCYVASSGAEDDARKVATPAPAASGQAARGVDPDRVMSVRACLGCHGAETLSWMNSTHRNSHLRLRDSNAGSYAEELGIAQDKIRESRICMRCHATGQTDRHGVVRALTGVTCESCHGASGGDDGWLNAHAVYGPNGTTFEQESVEHRNWRRERCEEAGMLQASQIYDMAKRCLECHLVENEALVNAGHGIGIPLEFLGQTTGEVRHNFHEDQYVNAKGPTLWSRRTGEKVNVRDRQKFVVGLLTEIETSLRAFSQVKEESYYSSCLVERAAGGWGLLAEAGRKLKDDFPEQLAEVVEWLGKIENLNASDENSRRQAADWADVVGKLAREYAAGDGASLEAFDAVLGELAAPVGKPFERK